MDLQNPNVFEACLDRESANRLVDDYLRSHGCTSTNTNAARVIKEGLETGELIDALANDVQTQSLETAEKALAAAKKTLQITENTRRMASLQASNELISDRKIAESVLVYRKVLEATADVFGVENMQKSESAMCKAIEAASYGLWRSIMGPKDMPFQQKSRL